MQIAFAPMSLGFIIALIVLLLTVILALPMIGMIPLPIAIMIVLLAASRLC